MSVVAVPLSRLCAGLMLNLWVGYFPTVQTAWGQLTDGPLPGQTDSRHRRQDGRRPGHPGQGQGGRGQHPRDASKFKHRGELVYLPPAYFASNPPPALPTVMMIGGQFNTAADWIRAANAVATIDDFAARHDGNAPVFVFADSGGAFNNDTECVNGVRGNAADHLTKDVVPYMRANFGVSEDPANWGVVGWSTGGTCALNLTVKYPELFSTFVDIDGDIAPNAGTKAQTIERLFGGNAAAYAQWDPATVMAEHGTYEGVAGWFAVSDPGGHPHHSGRGFGAAGGPDRERRRRQRRHAAASRSLCRLASEYGVDCAVVPETGKHDWPFAAAVFTSSLPWLASPDRAPRTCRTCDLPGTRARRRDDRRLRRTMSPWPTKPDSTPQPAAPAARRSASSPVSAPDTGYTDAGVPTLEGVREKIETRYSTALGATELAEETPEGRTAAEQYEAQQKAAAEKLDGDPQLDAQAGLISPVTSQSACQPVGVVEPIDSADQW